MLTLQNPTYSMNQLHLDFIFGGMPANLKWKYIAFSYALNHQYLSKHLLKEKLFICLYNFGTFKTES